MSFSSIQMVFQKLRTFANNFGSKPTLLQDEVIARAKIDPQTSSPSSLFYEGKEYKSDESSIFHLPFMCALVALATVIVGGVYMFRNYQLSLKKLENKIRSYEIRHSHIKQDYITVKDSLASEIKNRTALLNSKRKLETDIANIRRDFDSCRQELHTHKCKTEFDFNEKNARIQDLEVANNILQNENGKLRKHLQEKDLTIQHLEQALNEKHQKEEKFNQVLAETNARLQAHQQQGDNMKCLIDRLEASLKTKEDECITLHHLLEDRAKQIENMVVQNEILKDNLKKEAANGNNKERLLRELSIKHDQLLHSFSELECRLGEKTEEFFKAKKERDTLSGQVMHLKEEVHRLLMAIDKLNQDIDKRDEDNHCLKVKIQKVENENRENEQYCEKLRKQLDVFVRRRNNILAEMLAEDDDLLRIQ